jgi:hypothetical protein
VIGQGSRVSNLDGDAFGTVTNVYPGDPPRVMVLWDNTDIRRQNSSVLVGDLSQIIELPPDTAPPPPRGRPA